MSAIVRSQRLPRRSVGNSIVRQRADRMLRALGMEDRELSILLCDDNTIRRLNRQHRGYDRATDVLAFPMDTAGAVAGAPLLLGDIVISVPTARRQARQRHVAIVAEVTMLLAHGLLHLIGLDHRTAAEDRRMRARTDVLVSAAASHRR